MIKATEIRIGNWVNEFGSWHRIEAEDFMLDIFNPIPLTENILLKCGFESLLDDPECTGTKTPSGQYVIINNDNVVLEIMFGFLKDGTMLVHLNDCEFPNLKHVHQLQNLYFALTGEELICNLK